MSGFSPSTIEAMMQSIRSQGLVFPNRFEVILYPPPVLTNAFSVFSMQTMTIRCDSVTIPGRSFNTVPYRIYGPARNMPVEITYSGEMNLTYILSADLRERQVFEYWMSAISNPDDYKFEYYSSYVTTAQINVIDRSERIVHTALVEEVYPKTLGDLQMGYERDNEVLKQDITLSFRKYTPDYSGGQAALATQTASNLLGGLTNFIPGSGGILPF